MVPVRSDPDRQPQHRVTLTARTERMSSLPTKDAGVAMTLDGGTRAIKILFVKPESDSHTWQFAQVAARSIEADASTESLEVQLDQKLQQGRARSLLPGVAKPASAVSGIRCSAAKPGSSGCCADSGGLPKDRALKVEVALKVDKCLIIVHGTAEEASKVSSVLGKAKTLETAGKRVPAVDDLRGRLYGREGAKEVAVKALSSAASCVPLCAAEQLTDRLLPDVASRCPRHLREARLRW